MNEDEIALDLADYALDRATRTLRCLSEDPQASLAALSQAQRHYELAKVHRQRCMWQLRIVAAHAARRPPRRIDSIVVVGRDRTVRDSLAVLLSAKGYGRPKAAGFDCWLKLWMNPLWELVILDVPEYSVSTCSWFIESFRTAVERPHFIALARPKDTTGLFGKVDAVVAKPLVLDDLLQAIEGINEKNEARLNRV